MECEICGKDLISIKALSQHILNPKISSQDYYNKFIKKSKEGFCLECTRMVA